MNFVDKISVLVIQKKLIERYGEFTDCVMKAR